MNGEGNLAKAALKVTDQIRRRGKMLKTNEPKCAPSKNGSQKANGSLRMWCELAERLGGLAWTPKWSARKFKRLKKLKAQKVEKVQKVQKVRKVQKVQRVQRVQISRGAANRSLAEAESN